MLDLPGPVQATWKTGAPAAVMFSVTANHGGGYSYRLCPASAKPTEECFQQHHLDFASLTSWVVDRTGTEVLAFDAARTSNGTFPLGSQWTKNPFVMEDDASVYGTPLLPDMMGPGPQKYSVKDLLWIPKDMEQGKYVLSFRWDAESTKQVWQSCSDVLITNHDESSAMVAKDRPVCTGASWGLDVSECDAWVEFYDTLNGPNWKECSEYRLDPCACPQDSWGAKNILQFIPELPAHS